ncbi:MAG TPA: hypothetical protein VGM68_00640 [Rhizomicrobium sp.]|jgi:hypothetical protein
MTLRLAAALTAALALSACTDADWSHSMNAVGLGDSDTPEGVSEITPPAPVAAPAQTAQAEQSGTAFCAAVARQDSERGAFDTETREGIFNRNYRQCLSIFGTGAAQ